MKTTPIACATVQALGTEAGDLDLDNLEALARAATPGPWKKGSTTLTTHRGCEGSWWELHSIMMAPEGKAAHWQAGFMRDESNAAFIAAANPNAILTLIALARRAAPATSPHAALDSAAQPVSADALQKRVLEAWANYERMGEVCSFEGNPMIYASTLEEIAALAQQAKKTEGA